MMSDSDKLAEDHAKMKLHVMNSMPPGYYTKLTQFEKGLIDTIVMACFKWHRSNLFRRLYDEHGGISELAKKLEAELEEVIADN